MPTLPALGPQIKDITEKVIIGASIILTVLGSIIAVAIIKRKI